MRVPLGTIMSGSLSEGFMMRVHPRTELEGLKTGKFVCIHGVHYKFFSLITDIALHVSHPDIVLYPPEEHEYLLQQFLHEKDMYATVMLKPMLMLDGDEKKPVKTVPHHFAPVFEAEARDIARIFGDEKEANSRFFAIGKPLDMPVSVCIDLERLTERSNSVFGKTGTGKTFITRLIIAGLIKHKKAINLIFDMHSEYGLQSRAEGSTTFVRGLKNLFPQSVAIFSLDPLSTRRRGSNPDVTLTFNYDSILVEDILSLQEELNLHATALEAAYLIAAKYKKKWLVTLLSQGEQLKEFASELGAHPESIAALYRKLKRIERLPFFVNDQNQASTGIDQIMEYLDRGIHVIIEFGNHSSTFIYLLVANIITRRIHQVYIEKTEKFLSSQRPEDEPKKLLITIEEAHKFLNPQAARQTIFGTIAREMRKYYVSLLIVDQRPSGIDQEILSQIGTKIIAQLNDEKDINAVLMGINNAHHLRTVLASLDSKKQALIVGHAVAMPMVIETRSYDTQFFHAMQDTVTKQDVDDLIKELF